jgi:flagellar motor switch protein FliN/FliY
MTRYDAPVLDSETTKQTGTAIPGTDPGRNLDLVMRIPVSVQVVLGSAVMTVANLMKLSRGSVVKLDHRVGEPVDILVNGHIVARGEVVVVEEETSRLGVSLTEIVGPPAAATMS